MQHARQQVLNTGGHNVACADYFSDYSLESPNMLLSIISSTIPYWGDLMLPQH